MISWLLKLPSFWLVVVVLAATFLVAGVILLAVTRLGQRDQLSSVTSITPGILSPLGVVFGLIVAFLASGIWSNADDAKTAVNTEASSLRASVLLSGVFPRAADERMRVLIARGINHDVRVEWPAMVNGTANISSVPTALNGALHLALDLRPRTPGQIEAQRELITQLEDALDARRQRILVSHSQVNAVKWVGVIALGCLLILTIACVHAKRRGTAIIAVTIFAAAVGFSMVLLLSQDRAFDGPYAIKPTPLEQVRPMV